MRKRGRPINSPVPGLARAVAQLLIDVNRLTLVAVEVVGLWHRARRLEQEMREARRCRR